MTSPRLPTLAGCLALAAASAACRGGAPRMQIVTQQVRAGDVVVVRFDAPPVRHRPRGDVWLALVPAGSGDDYVGERSVIEVGAAEAAVPTPGQGSYELRLVDRSPQRFSSVVARVRLHVERAAAANAEAPPWYW